MVNKTGETKEAKKPAQEETPPDGKKQPVKAPSPVKRKQKEGATVKDKESEQTVKPLEGKQGKDEGPPPQKEDNKASVVGQKEHGESSEDLPSEKGETEELKSNEGNKGGV